MTVDEYQRLDSLHLAKAGKCDGSCESHSLPVFLVRVHHSASGHDWGWFAYCQQAINEDRSRGLRVDVEHIPEEQS